MKADKQVLEIYSLDYIDIRYTLVFFVSGYSIYLVYAPTRLLIFVMLHIYTNTGSHCFVYKELIAAEKSSLLLIYSSSLHQ